LSNTNTTTDATLTFRGKKYTVPAWSVSLLPDCQHEEYNTAKVRENSDASFVPCDQQGCY